MRKLIPQSECKDKIKLYKCLKNKKVISGRPEMTEINLLQKTFSLFIQYV